MLEVLESDCTESFTNKHAQDGYASNAFNFFILYGIVSKKIIVIICLLVSISKNIGHVFFLSSIQQKMIKIQLIKNLLDVIVWVTFSQTLTSLIPTPSVQLWHVSSQTIFVWFTKEKKMCQILSDNQHDGLIKICFFYPVNYFI